MNRNLFKYHPPTPETAQKFEAIRAKAGAVVTSVIQGIYENLNKNSMYDLINEECFAFAELIEALCPESDDRKRAIDAVRLARNAFNERVAFVSSDTADKFLDMACDQLIIARWLANSAIALGSISQGADCPQGA